jgi:hypothetical protein
MPELAFFKLGKAVRYRYGDVLAFIETRRATSTLAARGLGRPRGPKAAAKTHAAQPRATSKKRVHAPSVEDQGKLF